MKRAIPIIAFLLFASMFGIVEASETHRNGFGGITPLNPTGLTIFNQSLMRSQDWATSSMILSVDGSILNTPTELNDFSTYDHDLTLVNVPTFQNSLYGSSVYTDGVGQTQYLSHPHTTELDRTAKNVTLIWWGELRNEGHNQYIMGKIGTSSPSPDCFYHYGFWLNATNAVSAVVTGTPIGCSPDWISAPLELNTNQTHGVGISFTDNVSGTIVDFWVDGNWIYQEQSTERIDDASLEFRVGARGSNVPTWCNCTHDEILVLNENPDNDTMKLLTTREHSIVVRSGPSTTPQGFGGLFFALPWIIVFGLLGWVFYAIGLSLKNIFGK